MSSDHINEFTQYVRILARGRNASRDLSREEAKHAITLMLNGDYLPEQLGAFFMLMRVKEETPEELAGFADACMPLWQDLTADIIWPSYAGKRRQPPWYMLAIQLLRDAGYSILIHGTEGHTKGRLYTSQVINANNITQAQNIASAKALIEKDGIAYLPCEALNAQFQHWLMSKYILGLRSPINTLLRLIAPQGCKGVQSVFHPNYGKVHQQACNMIGKQALIIKGEGGEFEINPERTTQCLIAGEMDQDFKVASIQPHFDNKQSTPSIDAIIDHWVSESDEYGHYATLHTAAVVLVMIEKIGFEQALNKAKSLWSARNKNIFNFTH